MLLVLWRRLLAVEALCEVGIDGDGSGGRRGGDGDRVGLSVGDRHEGTGGRGALHKGFFKDTDTRGKRQDRTDSRHRRHHFYSDHFLLEQPPGEPLPSFFGWRNLSLSLSFSSSSSSSSCWPLPLRPAPPNDEGSLLPQGELPFAAGWSWDEQRGQGEPTNCVHKGLMSQGNEGPNSLHFP